MIVVSVFFSLVTLLVSYVLLSYLKLFKARKACQWIPQAPRWPLLGSIFEFGGHTETLNDIARLTNNPSKICYVEIANHWNIIIRDYDFLEFILSSNTILSKSLDYDYLKPWLGTGLLIAEGAKWRKRRKVITPAFHFSILEQFISVFENNSRILVKKLNKEVLDGESVDIYKYVTACALDIICETAMGVNIDSQNGDHEDYVFAVKDMCRIATARSLSAWRGINLFFRFTEDCEKQKKYLNILHGFTNSVIEKRKRELQNSGLDGGNSERNNFGQKRKMAFLDLLLNYTVDGKPLSQEDIREEVDTFMFEGHDTTSSAISSALYLLASHPDIQKQVRDELEGIYGQETDRPTTYQDMQNMKYLDMVIKETLRLYPPVPFITRCVKEDTPYKGHIIPKGSIIGVYIYGMNRDPDYFEAPEEFRPERFMSVTGQFPYSYVPFSAGPRNCIGQKFAVLEMKSVISTVIKHFELYPTNPPHEMLLSSEAVLKSLNGVKIVLKKHQRK